MYCMSGAVIVVQLHVAACNGYMIVGEFLLDNMVAVSPTDNDSWTPIHHAALWRQVHRRPFSTPAL